jgi:hypothetical protein
MAYYRQLIGLSGVRKIKKDTKPCPAHIHPDEKISVIEINRLIPRGANFEYIFIPRHKRRLSFNEHDNTSPAMHDAIRRGLI